MWAIRPSYGRMSPAGLYPSVDPLSLCGPGWSTARLNHPAWHLPGLDTIRGYLMRVVVVAPGRACHLIGGSVVGRRIGSVVAWVETA